MAKYASRFGRGLPALVLALVGPACMSLTTEAPEAVVVARWDPAAGVMPSPTDLVRDHEAQRLDLPVHGELSAAERELRAFLNELDGYPLSTPVRVPFSAALAEPSLAGNVLLLSSAGAVIPSGVSFDPESNTVELTPAKGHALAPGATYVAAVRGYTHGARGAGGERVVADAAFSFVRVTESLLDHPNAMPGETRAEREAAAERLEDLRQQLAPYFEILSHHGWARDEVAVLTAFTTTTRGAVWFDAAAGKMPFPNDLLRQTDVPPPIRLPVESATDEDRRFLLTGLSGYEGFSTTAALTVEATSDLDRDAVLNPMAVRVFRIGEGEVGEHLDLERGVDLALRSFWVKPRVALEPGATYALVVTDVATDAGGEPLRAQVLGHFLRAESPLVVDGVSQVGSLSTAKAERLEAARLQVQPVLAHLAGQGLTRDRIAAVVPFTTLSPADDVLALRSALYQRDVTVELDEVDVRTPWERGMLIAMLNVETVITARMRTLEFVDPISGAFRPEGEAVEAPVELVVTIPRGVKKGQPIPVVIFGHGLYTSRELVYLAADTLARAGFATFSIDLPYHGARSVCRQNLECGLGASCQSDGKCYDDATGERRDIITVTNPFPEIPLIDTTLLPDITFPVTSGQYLIDTHDLFATRDHFLQALVDLMQGVRVIRGADWKTLSSGYTLDGGDLSYLGISLGGIVGAMFAGVEPEVESFILNVPGAGLVSLLESSTYFYFTLEQLLADKGIERDSAEYRSFVNAARWALDPADPLNFAHHATVEALHYVDPVSGEAKVAPLKRVLIQMAQGDLVVPNIATELLADRMGLPVSVYQDLGNHGMLFNPLPFTAGAAARDEMVEFLDAR